MERVYFEIAKKMEKLGVIQGGRSCCAVDERTVEQAVADGEEASSVVVGITNETAIVTATAGIITIQLARICATVNDCCVSIESATEDTTYLSTSQLVFVIHLAVDVLDEDTTVTSCCNQSDCSACNTRRNCHCALCSKVLDYCTS